MDLTQYLKGIGRRWKFIAACVIVALGVGLLLSPADATSVQQTTSFEAETFLLSTAGSATVRSDTSDPETVATLVTLGEIPERVADEIGGDPEALAASVQADTEDNPGFLTITATAPSASRARLVADTFADKLLEYLEERTNTQIEDLREELVRLDRQIARLDAVLPDTRGGGTVRGETPVETTPEQDLEQARQQTRLESFEFERQTLQARLQQVTLSSGGNPAGYEVVEEAVARPTTIDESGIAAPRSRPIRLLIAGAIGLLLGIALSLLLERLDTRIRSKDAAEEAFGLPVLAEIPATTRRRRGTVVADAFPRSPAANAFRLLAAGLQFGRQDGGSWETSANGGRAAPRTILVTSAEPREGRSTVVANLAATFAELGKRVVVMCCDYRSPTLHQTFGVDQEPGLAEALHGEGAIDVEALVQRTELERVGVVATGRVPEKTGELFGSDRMLGVLAALRSSADVVVIDTGPVLAASDWTQLLPHVDAVVVVARVGKTDTETAMRTSEVLRMLQAPVLGVALNGVSGRGFRRSSGRSAYRSPERVEARSGAPDEIELDEIEESRPDVPVAAEGGNGRSAGSADQADVQTSDPDGEIPQLARPARKE